MSEMRFDGKSVIVTGAGRGFGREHARLLARRGARLVLADYGVEMNGLGTDPSIVEAITKEINDNGGEATAIFANVSVRTEAERVVQTAVDTYGKLDVLVNNAGIYAGNWLEDVDSDQVRRMVEFHYLGTVWMTRAAWPHLKEGPGCIVNTASEAIIGNIPKSPDYAGPKGAVFAFTKAMALDGQRYGIRVNAISPRGNTRMATPEVLSFVFDAPKENFEGEYFESMRTEYSSSAITFLAHESCSLSGEVIVCGAGLAKRMALIETQGLSVPEGGLSPEDLRDGLDQLMDTTDAWVMVYDELR